MYKTTIAKPGIVAAMLGYTLLSANAYAQSNSAEVGVSVTVSGPVETEIRTIDSSGNSSAWERVAPESIEYYIDENDDYSWLDYVPSQSYQPKDNTESDAFYERLDQEYSMTSGNKLFEKLKSKALGLFQNMYFRMEYGF